jgi:hypothetical protein
VQEREHEDLGLSDLVEEAKWVGEQLARFGACILRDGPPPLTELGERVCRIEDAFENARGVLG